MPDRDADAARYVVGIDLGTTNTVVAYVDLGDGTGAPTPRHIEPFALPQLVAEGELGRAPTLPSFLYLPGPHDLPKGSTVLPWDATRRYAVGLFARDQGARVPGRLVASAKSWLSHTGVDRSAAILPWRAPHEVDQVSPVDALARFLRHVREAWDEEMAAGNPAHRLAHQEVVLTVPASFDEVARELTVRAAREAGLSDFVLLEEPLAAFYAWLDGHQQKRRDLEDGQVVLVCDVGGGTSDFSLIGVRRDDEEAHFERLAVGEHLMLGGDNMDHALARRVEAQIKDQTGPLDVQRWHQLVHQCRAAKETLLGDDPPEAVRVAVAARSSRLVGGTVSGTLRRDDVEQLVLDGFFPEATLKEPLHEGRRAGLTDMGLPYEPDPAVTRHLAAFWRRFRPLLQAETGRDVPRPDYVLFNGGVFAPQALRDRLRRIVGGWFKEGGQPEELVGPALDRAVARGAAHYGLVRRGERARVGSGSARAYYVGVAAGEDAPEDAQAAVCLVPRGAPEGFARHLDQMPVEALTNQPVTFHLFSSAARTGDAFGEVVHLQPGEAHAMPPIRTVLRFGRKSVARALPVELGVRLTEVGTLELWCHSRQTEHRWQLAFDVRQTPDGDAAAGEDAPARPEVSPDKGPGLEAIEAACAAVEAAFDRADAPGEALWNTLEETLDAPRDAWTIPVLRRLADVLLPLAHDRSAAHERAWLDLLGYMLRPGYGDKVDAWRLDQAWKKYMSGLDFPEEPANRKAWWLFWRRAGGGLPPNKQAQVYYDVRPFIQHKVRKRKRHPLYPHRLTDAEKQEAWQTLATFERLPDDVRVSLGQIVMEQMERQPSISMLWALSRLGTRQPLYGPLDSLVPAEEVGGWLKTLLDWRLPKHESVAYTLALLAQRTGDRARDVPGGTHQQVVGRLRRLADDDLVEALEDPAVPLPDAARAWFLGEPMPEEGTDLPVRTGILYAEQDTS